MYVQPSAYALVCFCWVSSCLCLLPETMLGAKPAVSTKALEGPRADCEFDNWWPPVVHTLVAVLAGCWSCLSHLQMSLAVLTLNLHMQSVGCPAPWTGRVKFQVSFLPQRLSQYGSFPRVFLQRGVLLLPEHRALGVALATCMAGIRLHCWEQQCMVLVASRCVEFMW